MIAETLKEIYSIVHDERTRAAVEGDSKRMNDLDDILEALMKEIEKKERK